MEAPTLDVLHDAPLVADRELASDEYQKPPHNRAARGILTGVVLGAGLWAGILYFAGIIHL